MTEETVKCSRCEAETPESELIEVHAWWLCDICYDEV
jgi:formylmethanofuran dehydrogenase subunit E